MGIVPSVVAPVFDATDEILDSIAVEVGQPPLVVPQPRPLFLRSLGNVPIRGHRQRLPPRDPGPRQVVVLEARRERTEPTIDVRSRQAKQQRSQAANLDGVRAS
jgi:hypothetical protein